MYKISLLSILLWISLLCLAQKRYSVFSIRYKTFFREAEDDAFPSSQTRQLDIMSDGSSAFYPYYGKAKYIDSQSKDTTWIDERWLYSKRIPYRVYKNFPQEGELTFTGTIHVYKYTYEEAMPDMKWEMLEGDSIICQYPCQKAKTTYRGRTWTVWYTEDLPYPEGPWKLCGLPGVILKAQDAKGDFSFSAFKIGKNMILQEDKQPFVTKGYKKVTHRQFEKDQYEYYKDKALFATGKSLRFEHDKDAKAVMSPATEPCLMEYLDK